LNNKAFALDLTENFENAEYHYDLASKTDANKTKHWIQEIQKSGISKGKLFNEKYSEQSQEQEYEQEKEKEQGKEKDSEKGKEQGKQKDKEKLDNNVIKWHAEDGIMSSNTMVSFTDLKVNKQ